MSRPRPITRGEPRPSNTVVLLREAYLVLNDLVIARLAERGHEAVRPAHGAVFQYLDDTGTTVSTLAVRAQMTKQAMAELVLHLERHGYVERVPDPADRRAKLVRPTETGQQVVAIAQEFGSGGRAVHRHDPRRRPGPGPAPRSAGPARGHGRSGDRLISRGPAAPVGPRLPRRSAPAPSPPRARDRPRRRRRRAPWRRSSGPPRPARRRAHRCRTTPPRATAPRPVR